MVVSLIEFHFEFLLPELESVSIFIFVSKYHVSIFLPIYLAGKIPFFLRQIHEKVIVPQSSNCQKRRFCIPTFHTILAKFQKPFFLARGRQIQPTVRVRKNWQKNCIILHRLFLIFQKRKVSPLVSSDIQMSKMDFIEWAHIFV